jgi:hypothetical protein
MTLLLSNNVDLFDGVTILGARPAVIQLHEDRFVLARVGPNVTSNDEVVFDVPLAELKVRGSGSALVFVVGRDRKRVDFSIGGRLASGFGIAGLIAANSMIAKSGIGEWVAALRALGVQTRYISYARIVWWSVAGTAVFAAMCIAIALSVSPPR